jgi:hypothetical protein
MVMMMIMLIIDDDDDVDDRCSWCECSNNTDLWIVN